MLDSDAPRVSDTPADHPAAAPGRLGQLMDVVAAGVADISTAASALGALPAVLASIARVVRFDRVLLIEAVARIDGYQAESPLFAWTAPSALSGTPNADALLAQLAAPGAQNLSVPIAVEGQP